MASDEWLQQMESAARSRRNAEREQQRLREEHLSSLNDDRRTAYLNREQQAEDSRQRLIEQALLQQDEEQRRESRAAAAKYKRDRPLAVLDIWQSLRGHKLSGKRRNEFLTHPDIEAIGMFDRQSLGMAGRRTMAEHDGELRLAHWLQEAHERDLKQKARDEVPDWRRNLPPG